MSEAKHSVGARVRHWAVLRTKQRLRTTSRLVREWNEEMHLEYTDGPARGTRWKRASGMAIPATVAIFTVGMAIVQGILAASFNVANQRFTLIVDHASADG